MTKNKKREKNLKRELIRAQEEVKRIQSFSDTPKVDKYGRPISSDKVAKELQRYYKLRDDEFKSKSESSESDEEQNHATTEEETDIENNDLPAFDHARGEGAYESSDNEVENEELIEQESDEYHEE
ncbi:14883_t:CDS:2, partial [Funneliformis caledonium]